MALMKKLTSAVAASTIVLSLAGTAGATTPDKVQNAATRMQKLNLVKGVDTTGTDLALNANLTRAQLVTILVRAFGQDSNAKYLDGAAAFTDTANHPWASGYIAMAKKIISERTSGKEVVGLPDGSFNPDGNVTAAEAVAFLMKFVGAPADSTQAWPDNYISGALNAGIISAEDKAVLDGIKNAPATRGLAFYLADNAFYGYKLSEGGTVYTTFVDAVKPALTVDAVAATTLEDKVTVTGTVGADVTTVYVGSVENAATVTDGKFTATVTLAVGDNNIVVHAVDRAGNAAEQTVKVTRTVGAAATIEASDITVAAGATAEVKVVVKDAKGNVIADAAVTGESAVGTLANGSFKAGEKAGEGTLTLKVGELTKAVKVTVNAAALAKVEADKVSAGPGEAVKLVAKDQFGNVITGVTFSQDSADALLDATTGTFIATKAGSYTVKATKDGVTAEGKIGVYGDVSKLVISAPESVIANDATEVAITVTAVDKNGNVVSAYDKDITVDSIDGFTLADDVTPETKDGVAVFHYTASKDLANSVLDLTATTTDADGNDFTGEGSINVLAQVATSVEVSAPAYLPTNNKDQAQTVAVYVKDQAGEDMLTGSWDLDVALTGPSRLENGTKTDTVTITPDENTFLVYPDDRGTTGSVDVNVSGAGLTAGKDTMTAAFASAAKAVKVTASDDSATVAASTDTLDAHKNYVEYKVQLVDQNGVPVTDAAADRQVQLSFSSVGSSTRIFISTLGTDGTTWSAFASKYSNPSLLVDVVNGVGKFRLLSNQARSVAFTVNDTAGSLSASSAITTAFNAGKPAVVALASNSLNLKLADTAKGDVVAQLYDKFGNIAKTAGVKVHFTVGSDLKADYEDVSLNDAAEAQDVRTDANGQAKVTVGVDAAIPEAGVVVNVGAEYDAAALDLYTERDTTAWPTSYTPAFAETTTVKLASRVADSIKAAFSVPTFAVGDAAFDLSLTVKDNYGKPMTNLTAEDFMLTASSSSVQGKINDGTVTFDDTDSADGVYTFKGFNPTAAGTLTITAQVASASSSVKTSRNITVNPAAASAFDVAEETTFDNSNDKLVASAGVATPFTLELLDSGSNLAKSGSKIRFSFDTSVKGTSTNGKPVYLDIRDSSGASISYLDLASGRTTGKFYLVTNAKDAEVTITATTAGTDGALGTGDDVDAFTAQNSTLTLLVNPSNAN
jgi:hypothetical protein